MSLLSNNQTFLANKFNILLPFTMATVVWARYTEGFVTQLGAVYQERGKNDANSLVKFLTGLDETMGWQLAGTKNQYLECQNNECLHYTTEGVARAFKGILLIAAGENILGKLTQTLRYK